VVVLPVGITGTKYYIKDESGVITNNNYTITVSATTPNTIDGLPTAVMVGNYAAIEIIFNNNWNII